MPTCGLANSDRNSCQKAVRSYPVAETVATVSHSLDDLPAVASAFLIGQVWIFLTDFYLSYLQPIQRCRRPFCVRLRVVSRVDSQCLWLCCLRGLLCLLFDCRIKINEICCYSRKQPRTVKWSEPNPKARRNRSSRAAGWLMDVCTPCMHVPHIIYCSFTSVSLFAQYAACWQTAFW